MKSPVRLITTFTQTFMVQLGLSFAVIIILMASTLAVGVYSLNQMREQAARLERANEAEQQLLQLRVALLEENFSVERYVLLNQYQAFYDYLSGPPTNLDSTLKNYIDTDSSTGHKYSTFHNDLIQSKTQLDQLNNELVAQLKAGNASEASQTLQTEFTTEVNHFNSLLTDRLGQLQAEEQSQETATDRISQRSNYLMVAGGVVIALISITAASMLVVLISRRVAALRRAVEEVGRGNFKVRTSSRGQDELSRVGTAFNQMAGKLEALVTTLEARNTELEALQDFNRRLEGTTDLREAASRALEVAIGVVQAETGRIYLLDENNPTELKMLAGEGSYMTQETGGGATVKADKGLTGQAFQTSQLISVGNLTELVRQNPTLTSDPIPKWNSGLFVPLITGGRTIGVMSLAARPTNHFTSDRLRFVETLAGQIATAIQQVLLLESVRESEKIEAVLTMARTAAHELRQPLTVLQAELDMIAELGATLDTDRLDRMQAAIAEMNSRVSSYQRVVRYETDRSLPDAPVLDREKALSSMGKNPF